MGPARAAPRAPPPADLDAGPRLADAFSAATLEKLSRAGPARPPARVRGRIVLSHGRADRLIPYTETLRLQELLPPAAKPAVTITGLFAHSVARRLDAPPGPRPRSRPFIRLLNDALSAV